jgi:hypothetical protein
MSPLEGAERDRVSERGPPEWIYLSRSISRRLTKPSAICSASPEKPSARKAATVLSTCSRQGEKQQILVIVSGRSVFIA